MLLSYYFLKQQILKSDYNMYYGATVAASEARITHVNVYITANYFASLSS